MKYVILVRSLTLSLLATSAATLFAEEAELEVKEPICGNYFTHQDKTDFVSCFYVGAGLGISLFDPNTRGSTWKQDQTNDVALALYGGYQFTRDWFVEGLYADLGKATLQYNNPLVDIEESISYKVAAAYAGYYLPFDWIADTRFYVKAGISYLMRESSASTLSLDKEKSVLVPAMSVGVEWRFADDWTLRGEFNSFSNRTRMADISIAYWFGNGRYRPEPIAPVVEPEPIEEEIIEEVVAEALQEPTLEQLEARNIEALANETLPALNVDISSTELSQSSLNELDALVTALETYPDVRIEIRGHTDSTGSHAFNQKLSERRAERVYNYLVEHGIDASRLRQIGFGENMPIADNDTEEGRRQNRRIDFVILDKEAK